MTPLEQAFAEGRLAERDRIGAILAAVSPEQLATAIALALKSPNMSAADVVAFIASIPEPRSASIAERMSGFNAAMFSLGHGARRAGASEWSDTISKQQSGK
jgi:hypothetical protein